MNKNGLIVSDNSVTVIRNGKPQTIRDGHPGYQGLRADLAKNRFDRIDSYFNMKSIVQSISTNLLIKGDQVIYRGENLANVLSDKLLSVLKTDFGRSSYYIKYLENLLKNSSYLSVRELYDFLTFKELPIDEDGYVIAYKGVRDDGYSVMGNRSTVVLQGHVDSSGHILNEVGTTIEVERRCVDDNRRNSCSHGLHLGSYAYASGWGQKLLLVRFNPADAVSVPEDCECQKLRVCKYEILEDLSETGKKEIKKSTYTKSDRIADKIVKYLENCNDYSCDAKQVQSALKISGLTCKEIVDICLNDNRFIVTIYNSVGISKSCISLSTYA